MMDLGQKIRQLRFIAELAEDLYKNRAVELRFIDELQAIAEI